MNDHKAYPAWQFALDATAITVFITFAVFYTISLSTNYAARADITPYLWLSLILHALLAWLTADFVSGFVHFLADNFGNASTPFFGKLFIFPFREHHVDPKAITRHSFTETNGANCMVSLPGMIYVFYASPAVADYTFRFYMIFFFFSIFLTNQIHKWSHMDHPPKAIAFLQRAHIILPPLHHDVHHAKPYDKYYCITCGWLNPVLEQLHFFQAVKRVLRWDFR